MPGHTSADNGMTDDSFSPDICRVTYVSTCAARENIVMNTRTRCHHTNCVCQDIRKMTRCPKPRPGPAVSADPRMSGHTKPDGCHRIPSSSRMFRRLTHALIYANRHIFTLLAGAKLRESITGISSGQTGKSGAPRFPCILRGKSFQVQSFSTTTWRMHATATQ